jgi:hypothetical protein
MRKVCTACKIEKDFSEFPKKQKGRTGVRAECILCSRVRANKRYYANRENCNAKGKEWRLNNKEKVAVGMDKWRSEHKEETKEYNRSYRENYPEIVKAAAKNWRVNNPDKVIAQRDRERKSSAYKERIKNKAESNKEYMIQWRKDNPEKSKQQMKRANAKRSKIMKYRISGNISNRIREKLLKGTKARQHWEELVDFTVDQLRNHLEKLFKPGMTWDNYGTVWQIDHKIPIAAFNFNKPDDIDFKLCWSIKNLQPLETVENKKKSAKVDHEFLAQLRASV